LTDLGPQRSAVATRRSTEQGKWLAVHILDQECKCSQRVLDRVLAEQRPTGIVERVVMIAKEVSPARIAAIHAKGLDLDIVTPEELGERYRVQAAPLLIVLDPEDAVRYVGGYTPRKQADDVRDLAMIAALRRGEHVEPLPTFGCAVGRALKDKIDPLGIRNWK
jgi:thioredoxin-related protein